MRIDIRNEKFLYIKIAPVFSVENRRFFVVMQTEKRNLSLNDVQEKEQSEETGISFSYMRKQNEKTAENWRFSFWHDSCSIYPQKEKIK